MSRVPCVEPKPNRREPVEGPWLDLTKIEKALAVNSGMMLVVPAGRSQNCLSWRRSRRSATNRGEVPAVRLTY
jgi:hypothetical protein